MILTNYTCYDEQEIKNEQEKVDQFLQSKQLCKKVNIFKLLGDLNRIKIIELLANYDKLCVYEISRLINASVATTSHHLIALKNNHLIGSKKEGKHVLYFLEDPKIIQVLRLAAQLGTYKN